VVSAWGKNFHYPLGGLPWLTLKYPLFGIAYDSLSALMLLAITIVGFLVVIYSAGYLSDLIANILPRKAKEGITSFYCFSSGRWLVWFFPPIFSNVDFLGTDNFMLLGFNIFLGNKESLAAGYKALLITHAAGLFFVAAILVIYHYTGSFEYSALKELPTGIHSLVLVFLFIAAAGKAAQFPLFTWLPTAMAAPTPASAYLHAAAMVKAGIYLTARCWYPEGQYLST
jgi:hydrogenase-4 component D